MRLKWTPEEIEENWRVARIRWRRTFIALPIVVVMLFLAVAYINRNDPGDWALLLVFAPVAVWWAILFRPLPPPP